MKMTQIIGNQTITLSNALDDWSNRTFISNFSLNLGPP